MQPTFIRHAADAVATLCVLYLLWEATKLAARASAHDTQLLSRVAIAVIFAAFAIGAIWL